MWGVYLNKRPKRSPQADQDKRNPHQARETGN